MVSLSLSLSLRLEGLVYIPADHKAWLQDVVPPELWQLCHTDADYGMK